MNPGELSFRPPRTLLVLCGGLVVVGAAAFAVGLIQSPERAWLNLLLVSFYLLSLGLGALVFIAIQYVTGAAWSVALRRVPEAMAALIPVAALGLAIVFLVRPSLYPWAAAAPSEIGNPLRHGWFNRPFFLARAAFCLVCWIALGFALVRNSRRQDSEGSLSRTRSNIRLSCIFLVVFALTFWQASQDWLMSLDGEWSSTIFAVYQFGGLFVGGLAAITLLVIGLRGLGPFRNVLGESHIRDLGNLLLGFSAFWGYLWFSQSMLIWYVNNPAEAVWYTRRLQGDWAPLFYLNVVLNWVVPLVVLLPRAAKKRAGVVAAVAGVVLVGHWLDLYLQILPRIRRLAAARCGVGDWIGAGRGRSVCAGVSYVPETGRSGTDTRPIFGRSARGDGLREYPVHSTECGVNRTRYWVLCTLTPPVSPAVWSAAAAAIPGSAARRSAASAMAPAAATAAEHRASGGRTPSAWRIPCRSGWRGRACGPPRCGSWRTAVPPGWGRCGTGYSTYRRPDHRSANPRSSSFPLPSPATASATAPVPGGGPRYRPACYSTPRQSAGRRQERRPNQPGVSPTSHGPILLCNLAVTNPRPTRR